MAQMCEQFATREGRRRLLQRSEGSVRFEAVMKRLGRYHPYEFPRVDMRNLDLRRINGLATKARFARLDLGGSILPKTCWEADFTDARLTGALLRGCEAMRARFRYSLLARADFSGANLHGADFSISRYFENAIFDGANLTDATLPTMPLARWAKLKHIETIIGLPWDLVAAIEAFKVRRLLETRS